jgi:hypothetical protein
MDPSKPKINAIAAMRQIIVVSVAKAQISILKKEARKSTKLLSLKRRSAQKLLAKAVDNDLATNPFTLNLAPAQPD